jgi:AraC family transcriptional regulator
LKTFTGSVFAVDETHGRVLRGNNRLIAHSQSVGWRSLYAAIFEEGPTQTAEPAIGHPYFIYHLGRPTIVARKVEGNTPERALIGPRRICTTPSGVATHTRHDGAAEILQVYLRQSIYESAVREMYGCDVSDAMILPRFAIVDPLLEQLAIAVTTALRNQTVLDGLYIDTIAHMIAVHLAYHHSTRSRATRCTFISTISSSKMRRLIEFVEEHLDRDLSLKEMAEEIGMSPFYLPRAFRSALGKSPHQYVLERRIERARELLLNTDLPTVDIALASGFSSQSHLSNWFVRMVGIPPAAYRRQGHSQIGVRPNL